MREFTDITLILDNSSSMGGIKDATRIAVNQFIEEQKKVPFPACFTLVKFSDPIHIGPLIAPPPLPHIFSNQVVPGDPRSITCDHTPLEAVLPLGPSDYIPNGNTALHDAIGLTLDQLGIRLEGTPEPDRPNKVVIVIMTDGAENASRTYTKSRVSQMIQHQRETYNWQFMYLGANQDSFAVGQALSIPTAAVMNYAHNDAGMRRGLRATSDALFSYRSNQSSGTAFNRSNE